MVMLTHQDHQQFRFENLGICIQVRRCGSEAPRVDVNVPEDIFRVDLDKSRWSFSADASLSDEQAADRRHAIRNRLHVASMCLDVLQNQIARGEVGKLEPTLKMALDSLTALEKLAV